VDIETAPAVPTPDIARAIAEIDRRLEGNESPTPVQDGQALQRALELVRNLEGQPDEPALAEGLRSIARYACASGKSLEGLRPSLRAVEMFRRLGPRARLQQALLTRGMVLCDIGNLPLAIEAYAEALAISIEVEDVHTQAKICNNLGVVLNNAAHYADALPCFERAISLCKGDPSLRHSQGAALANVALVCLHLEDYERGLPAAQQAVELTDDLTTLFGRLRRVVAETTYTRLLLEVDRLSDAWGRCEIAKRIAREAGLERGHFEAELAQGLCEAYSGMHEEGFARLSRVLELARDRKWAVLDALGAVVTANERANRHDMALVCLRELMLCTKELQRENALLHHRLHLDELERQRGSASSYEVLAAQREARLRGKLVQHVAHQELIKARVEMLDRIAVIAELRVDATGQHSYRVGKLAALLAQALGWDENTVFLLESAARLHDIGWIGVPQQVLTRLGPLTGPKAALAQSHTAIGAEILARTDLPHAKMAEEIARFHHEHWDGSGYPFGLGYSAIPMAARITALADAFDELTHAGAYEAALPAQAALGRIVSQRGRQFDPHLTDALITLIPRLQRIHGELDGYLSQAGRESPLIQARQTIASRLKPPGVAACGSERR
jgi:putative two-component system response regulator